MPRRSREHGLQCAIARGTASLCGYVQVPPCHPCAHVQHYGEVDVDVEVHGGLTWFQRAVGGGMWFGFDCCHFEDWIALLGIDIPGTIWTVNDVAEEVEKLAEQLKRMGGQY